MDKKLVVQQAGFKSPRLADKCKENVIWLTLALSITWHRSRCLWRIMTCDIALRLHPVCRERHAFWMANYACCVSFQLIQEAFVLRMKCKEFVPWLVACQLHQHTFSKRLRVFGKQNSVAGATVSCGLNAKLTPTENNTFQIRWHFNILVSQILPSFDFDIRLVSNYFSS